MSACSQRVDLFLRRTPELAVACTARKINMTVSLTAAAPTFSPSHRQQPGLEYRMSLLFGPARLAALACVLTLSLCKHNLTCHSACCIAGISGALVSYLTCHCRQLCVLFGHAAAALGLLNLHPATFERMATGERRPTMQAPVNLKLSLRASMARERANWKEALFTQSC